MKTVGFRSIVLYLLLFAFLGGVGYLGVNLILNGSQWVMQPYNGHIYSDDSIQLGEIQDRNGNVLASTQDGKRVYSESETARIALLHTIGDPYGYIGTSIQQTMGAKLSGYNVVTGLNDTFLNRFTKNVDLTLDQSACTAAYNALGGKKGGVFVYNYETGEVLCKVSAPSFDPEYPPEDLETNEAYNGVYLDNTLSSSYTPGSIFKLVTAAAAMEKWPENWSERTYDCQGSAEIGGDQISCLHGDAHGTQDMFSALGNSCNVYFAQLAVDVGAEALQKQAEEMGFGRSFSFDRVHTEISRIDLSGCNENQLGWAGVGQYTVLANPCHMALVMSAVANGGSYTEPRLTQDGSAFKGLGGDRTLVTSSQAAQLKALMRSNVENYYGDWLFPKGMNVCAKTGTGEVGEDKAPNCWIVGFCDSSAYPYAFAVVAEEGIGGIETAGNIASAVLGALA